MKSMRRFTYPRSLMWRMFCGLLLVGTASNCWSDSRSSVPSSASTSSASTSSAVASAVESADSSSASSASSATAAAPTALDRALLKVTIAETTFQIEPSLENRGTLLLALEHVVEMLCMPRLLQTLEFQGGAGNPSCMEYVLKVFKLDSASPVAFCARDGIDSQNCQDAYRNQSAGTFGEPYQTPRDPEPLRPGMRPTIQDTVARLYHDAKTLRDQIRSSPTTQQRVALRQIFDRLLILSCPTTRLALQEIPSAAAQEKVETEGLLNRPLDPNLPVEKYVDALVKGAQGKDVSGQEAAEEYGPAFVRSRQVSGGCMFFVSEALDVEPEMATAICHRDGFSSPSCIQALRKEKRATFEALQQERSAKGLPTLSPFGPSSGARSSRAPGFKTF